MGRQTLADRGRVGIRGPGRTRSQDVLLGRRPNGEQTVDGQYLARKLPQRQHGGRRLRGSRPCWQVSCRTASACTTWPATPGSGVADFYHENYYVNSPQKNPTGPDRPRNTKDPERVLRGGSFACSDNYCKSYVPGARRPGEIDLTANHIGFRCAKSP